MKPQIIITAGDPVGIGPEITVAALNSKTAKRLDITVIGDPAALLAAGFKNNSAILIPIGAAGLDLKKHAPGARAGLASYKAVLLALEMLKTDKFHALVTAPVSKEAWKMAGVKHTGHTDLFRAVSGQEPLMGFSLGKIKVALVTEHYSVKKLPDIITQELIVKKTRLFYDALRSEGIRKPVITLAALNPHAGDGGMLGREEILILRPAIAKLKEFGIKIKGPLPSDAAWCDHLTGGSDGLLCMYHDQALTPLKILPRAKQAVHWTWGLPFRRTSPAHGTAFDIAGKNIASPTSMIAALQAAANPRK